MSAEHGMDYGLRPKLIVVGDVEFPELLETAWLGVGYTRLPAFGPLRQPPMLAVLFEDERSACDIFTRFSAWNAGTESGEGVAISFVEFNDGDYGICIYEEPERLTMRMVGHELADEVDLQLMIFGHLKRLEQTSRFYGWFKSVAAHSPFVLAPATEEQDFLALAFVKQPAAFYHEDSIPLGTVEAILVHGQQGAPKAGELLFSGARQRVDVSPEDVFSRRKYQLDRFFPVTLERLRHSERFRRTREQLHSEGYLDWQIIQAACNAVLQHRVPELFQSDGNTPEDAGQQRLDKIGVLRYLLASFEGADAVLPLDEHIGADVLRAQVQADAHDLLQGVMADNAGDISPNYVQLQLSERGFLMESSENRE